MPDGRRSWWAALLLVGAAARGAEAFVTLGAEGCTDPVQCGAKQDPPWEYPRENGLHRASKWGPYETRSIYHTFSRDFERHSPTGTENIALRVAEVATTGGRFEIQSTTLITYPVEVEYTYEPEYETRFRFGIGGLEQYQHLKGTKRNVVGWRVPKDLPVVAYARGAGGQVLDRKESYDHLASHGMVVVASLNPMFTALSLADEQVWDLLELERIAQGKEGERESRAFQLLHGKLKPGAWGAAGYSLGGASAVAASQMLPCGPDLRRPLSDLEKAVVQLLEANATEGGTADGEETAAAAAEKKEVTSCIRAIAALHSGTPIVGAYVPSARGGLPGDAVRAPVLFTSGALDPLMSSTLTTQYIPAKTPKLSLVGQLGDHFEPFGRYGGVITAWMLAYLKEDAAMYDALWSRDGAISDAMDRASRLSSPLFAAVQRNEQCVYCEELVNRTRFAPVWSEIAKQRAADAKAAAEAEADAQAAAEAARVEALLAGAPEEELVEMDTPMDSGVRLLDLLPGGRLIRGIMDTTSQAAAEASTYERAYQAFLRGGPASAAQASAGR